MSLDLVFWNNIDLHTRNFEADVRLTKIAFDWLLGVWLIGDLADLLVVF